MGNNLMNNRKARHADARESYSRAGRKALARETEANNRLAILLIGLPTRHIHPYRLRPGAYA